MTFKTPLITASIIALLSACGGGGTDVEEPRPQVIDTDKDGVADADDAFPNDPTETADQDSDGVGDNSDPFPKTSGIDLTSFADGVELQFLGLDGETTQKSLGAKSTTSSQWDSGKTLDYVTLLQNGDVVGIPVDEIPSSVTFEATGTASMLIVDGTTQYALTGGDVEGNISADAFNLTVNLDWAGNEEIYYVSEDQAGTAPDVMGMSVNYSKAGEIFCGSGNLFCGGEMSISSDGASIINKTFSSDQYIAGIYGHGADGAELGGIVNYVEQDTLSVIGNFVADAKF